MPKYDYKCDNCGEIQEAEHPMAETLDFHACPDCNEGLLHKVFSATPAVFKGQGWAKMTEYKPKENT